MGYELPLFSALSEKMRWHEARQRLLSENVANAETPGYRGRDLAVFNFEDHLKTAPLKGVPASTTSSQHIEIASFEGGMGGFEPSRSNSFEITPEGNGVTLEDEMMKVTTNQMDYQAVTSLYTRSMKIIRTALGR